MTTARAKDHLQLAHAEICTALTVVRSNVALVRLEMRATSVEQARSATDAHLLEVESAVDRLVQLTRRMKSWHANQPLLSQQELSTRLDGGSLHPDER